MLSRYTCKIVLWYSPYNSKVTNINSPIYIIVTVRKVRCKPLLPNSKFSAHMVKDRLKFKLKHTDTCSAATWLLHHLCLRPAIFFRPRSSLFVFNPTSKFRRAFEKCFLSIFIFLGEFAKFRKTNISFVISVCLSVSLSAWNKSAPTGRIFTKIDVYIFLWK